MEGTFFLINLKIIFCWLANGRSMLIERRLKNSDIFYPCIKIACSVCSNPLLSNIAFTRLRRWMFIAFNPQHDLWGSWYPFPRAATTVWLFCLLLKLHRHLQSKLWIVVPQTITKHSLYLSCKTFFLLEQRPSAFLFAGVLKKF